MNFQSRQLHFADRDPAEEAQDLKSIGLDTADFLNVLSRYDRYGAWRLDLETGLVYWTRDVFAIHNMPFSEGPVDLRAAIAAYHPDDRPVVTQCVEEATANKSGYRFVLRLGNEDRGYKIVKSTAAYREREDGSGAELYGTFSEFAARVRAVAIG